MSITKTTVNRPITILIGFVLVVVLGFFIQGRLALDLFPEITPPVVVIFTNYEGGRTGGSGKSRLPDPGRSLR
jgi:HAE1 family hydrophobic/amphiphilic exporter-1